MFAWVQRNLAALGVWPIETYFPNFVNFGQGVPRYHAATCINPKLIALQPYAKTDQIVYQHSIEGPHFCAEDLRGGQKLASPWNEHGFAEWNQWITVSTVVLNCCKGDKPSQWEYPIFGPLYSSKTPGPILTKFVTSDYVVDPTRHAKLGFRGWSGSVPHSGEIYT